MQFYDEVVISVASGRGGDGANTGRREKHVPYGGPSGGDGGDGGDVFIQASHHEYTLMPLRTNRNFKAGHGEPGGSKDKYGKHGDDVTVNVPIGTLIFDDETGEKLAELTVHGQRVRIAKGGKGGLGNIHFVDARKQFSTIFFYGEPNEKRTLRIEVQLIADIALMGAPSVGKSSLIASISNVKPKIAEYHFTTITPNIGVVEGRRQSFTVIDIPGLIEGAADGKGLGNTFLRHILKASALCLMVDIDRFDRGINDIPMLLNELETYIESVHDDIDGHTYEYTKKGDTLIYRAMRGEEVIVTKYLCLVVAKIDLVTDPDIREEYVSQCLEVMPTGMAGVGPTKAIAQLISMATREGIDDLIEWMETQAVQRSVHLDEEEETTLRRDLLDATAHHLTDNEVRMRDQEEHTILEELGFYEDHTTFKGKIFSVQHPDISYLSFVIPRGNDEAELRWRGRMESEYILNRVRELGGKLGDIIHIPSPYKTVQDRFIVRE